jgi:NADH:ubiquinone oxidoreductase subunit 5 (subunit L)/multisubunit Na+/H+ antiporter MnhA subunit
MNEETLKLVDKLAEKLGTTAERLFAIMVKQAPLSGAIQVILFLILMAIAGFFLWKCIKTADWDSEPRIILGIMSGLAIVILVVTALCSADLVLASFFNPEYWAVKQFIK